MFHFWVFVDDLSPFRLKRSLKAQPFGGVKVVDGLDKHAFGHSLFGPLIHRLFIDALIAGLSRNQLQLQHDVVQFRIQPLRDRFRVDFIALFDIDSHEILCIIHHQLIDDQCRNNQNQRENHQVFSRDTG